MNSKMSQMVSKKNWRMKLYLSSRHIPTLPPPKGERLQHLNRPQGRPNPQSPRISSQPKRGQVLQEQEQPRRRCDRVTYHTYIFLILLYPVCNLKAYEEGQRMMAASIIKKENQKTRKQLISSRTGRSISLPFEAQQDLLEAGEVRRTRACPRDGLALRVLQLDKVADALPGGACRQRPCQLSDVFCLRVSANGMRYQSDPRTGNPHLLSRILRSFFFA